MRQKNKKVKHFSVKKSKKAFDKRAFSRYNIFCMTME